MINVTATKWKLGWELALDSGGVTQARTLATAERQVRDYLDSVDPDVDHSEVEVCVVPRIGSVLNDVREARVASQAAQEATVDAARKMRAAVRGLRSAGLSVTDSAAVLGVSRGRVSQLMAEAV